MGWPFVLVGLLRWLALPPAGLEEPALAVLQPQYAAAMERYVSGDRDAAVAAVAALSERELRDQIDALRSLASRARACQECADAIAWRKAPVPAAIMLHTDCSRRSAIGATPSALHESGATSLARLVQDDPERRGFAQRWYAAMVGVAQAENRWNEALERAIRGVDSFPESPELWLALGAIEETIGGQTNLAPLELRAHLLNADRALRASVAGDPSLLEARLRLGRVAWRLGRPAEARAELAEVLARSPTRDAAFLAHLFLGRLQQDADQLEDAARSYAAAVALDPRCHSARVALSHALFRSGDAAGARRELEAALAPADGRKQPDPYWQYPWGAAVGVEARLERLRLEASQ